LLGQFAIETKLATPPPLQPKDMVYVRAQCAIAEVLEVNDDDDEPKVDT
jgi:hypothetical protein